MTTTGLTFDDLFRQEHASIVRAAYLVTGNNETAREVAQEAFADLFVRWRKVSKYDKPGAWVRRVAIQRAIKVANRDAKRPKLEESRAKAHPPDDVSEQTMAALSQLSPMQRAVVVLHYFQDLPVQDVAEMVGCKPATASVHLNRARTRLADLLGQQVETNVN